MLSGLALVFIQSWLSAKRGGNEPRIIPKADASFGAFTQMKHGKKYFYVEEIIFLRKNEVTPAFVDPVQMLCFNFFNQCFFRAHPWLI